MIFVLLILFQLKHFLADYPLQRPYMLQKFKADWGFLLPLVAHCGVHALFTFLIVLWAKPELALACAILDFWIHFVMDRVKAGPKYLGRFKALAPSEFKFHMKNIEGGNPGQSLSRDALQGNTYFWWALGLDQGVHHLTHYLIIWLVVS